ncbi:hypothetical protein BGZ83_002422 [Gryganskiella cystojenkinii]|nr:hypothetical protein BGZ83_002422 [Gryganskiella cystojenkinii]
MTHDVEMLDAQSERTRTTNVESNEEQTTTDSIPKSAAEPRANNESQEGTTTEDKEQHDNDVDYLAPLLASLESDNDEFAHSSFEFLDNGNEEEKAKELLHDLERQLEWKTRMKRKLIFRYRHAENALTKLPDLTLQERSQYAVKLREHKTLLQDDLTRDIKSIEADVKDLKESNPELQSTQSGQDQEKATIYPNSVKWDPKNRIHLALNRVLKEEYIPLVEGTNTIDFSRIRHKHFSGAPELELEVTAGTTSNKMINEIAVKVVAFRDAFKRHYIANLTEELFEPLAWTYMPKALNKARIAQEFTELIEEYQPAHRTWNAVQTCLYKAIKFENIEAHLADQVLRMRPRPNESVIEFSHRIKPLIDAASLSDADCALLARGLGNYLSDTGHAAVVKKYGSLAKVRSFKDFMKFLGNTPGALDGPKTDYVDFFLRNWGGEHGGKAAEA